MRVIVVGAGVVGLSAAWALSRAGHEPVVLDQGTFRTRSRPRTTGTA